MTEGHGLLELGRGLQQMFHLGVRILNVLRRIRALSIPSPLLDQFGLQLALNHLRDVLPKNGEEFISMERAARCDVKSLGSGVR